MGAGPHRWPRSRQRWRIAPLSDPSIRRPRDRHAGAFEPEKNLDPGSDQGATTPCPIKEPISLGVAVLTQTGKRILLRAIHKLSVVHLVAMERD
jgi:hypothetical protein